MTTENPVCFLAQECSKRVEDTTARESVEIVFSAFKRMFGEHLNSLKWKNMVKHRISVATYNMQLTDMCAVPVVQRPPVH